MKYLSSFLRRLANSHPYWWFIGWNIIPKLSFFLPHEKVYYAFRHFAKKDTGLFLDVGANNGMSALGFHKLIPHYNIMSIEANPQHIFALEKLKSKMSNFDFKIVAAGSEISKLTLYTASYNGIELHTGSSLNPDYMKRGYLHNFSKSIVNQLKWTEQLIDVVPLDVLNLNPDIIKIDAEGFDMEVIEGLSNTISKHRPFILIEYNYSLNDLMEVFCRDFNYSALIYVFDLDLFKLFDKNKEEVTLICDSNPLNVFLVPLEKNTFLN